VLPASGITALLLIEPDEALVQGAWKQEPREMPRAHVWKLRCDDPTFSVDELVANLMGRLAASREQLAELGQELATQDPPGCLRLCVVRYFDSDDGTEEVERQLTTPDGTIVRSLPGQHQLLGWDLDAETLSFLSTVGATISVYEYS
jgi:Domain of unknown function (DUF4279)